MKTFNLMCNVGSSKYVVNYHNGMSTHKDGSPFFDIKIFKNKTKMNNFLLDLKAQGYTADALTITTN